MACPVSRCCSKCYATETPTGDSCKTVNTPPRDCDWSIADLIRCIFKSAWICSRPFRVCLFWLRGKITSIRSQLNLPHLLTLPFCCISLFLFGSTGQYEHLSHPPHPSNSHLEDFQPATLLMTSTSPACKATGLSITPSLALSVYLRWRHVTLVL